MSDFDWVFLTYVALLCRTVYYFYLSFHSPILYDLHLFVISETERTDTNLLKELRDISPPDEEDERDVILYEEVERAVIHLKKNKSPKTDGVVGEMIKAGGDEMIKAIHE